MLSRDISESSERARARARSGQGDVRAPTPSRGCTLPGCSGRRLLRKNYNTLMGAGASTAPATGDDKAALPQAALEKAFKAADSDNDGFLTTAELATLLEGHGHAEPERKAKGLALWLSASKPDGVAGKEGVSVAEFVAAVAELNSFVKALVEKKAPAEKKPLPPTPRPEAPAAPTKPVPAAAATPPAAATSALDAGVFEEMNLARTKPAEYAAHLDAWLPHFDGKNYKPPGAATTLVTQEGAAAVTEAIEFLKKQTPLKPFAKVSEGMSRASLDHVLDCGPKGLLGHDGSDKSTPFERLNRHGQWQKTAGENINYGATVARDAVLALIVDDGVASRGHRCNIFSADFTVGAWPAPCALLRSSALRPAIAAHLVRPVLPCAAVCATCASRHRVRPAQGLWEHDVRHACRRLPGGGRGAPRAHSGGPGRFGRRRRCRPCRTAGRQEGCRDVGLHLGRQEDDDDDDDDHRQGRQH